MRVTFALHCSGHMRNAARRILLSFTLLCTLPGCDSSDGGATAAALSWRDAQEKWHRRDVDAYRAWTALPENTPEALRAGRLLQEADRHYRRGISLFAQDDIYAARQSFNEGAAIAPIDPLHYLTLARMYELKDLPERAARYYAKFSQALPDAPEAAAARDAARKVDPGFEGVFDPPSPQTSDPPMPKSRFVLPITLGGAVATTVLVLLLVLVLSPRLGVASLSRLIDQAPEMHTAVAYLIGSLRHELLKHRIGVAADVIQSLVSGETTGPQRVFLGERLFKGNPLDEAWRAHMSAFVRVLGPRFNPKRDRAFRRAERAVLRIAGLEDSIYTHSKSAIRTLSEARTVLLDFDRQLAFLQSKLVRTRVDTALLEQAAAEVRGEYAAGAVRLDDLFIEEVEGEISIEVPRGDLLLILKNVLRNAVVAVDRNDSDKRVGMGVRLSLEPTGQEIVRLCIWDTSPDAPSEAQLRGSRADSGLGLVMLAVRRYGGTLAVRDGAGLYCKEASIRFFRAFDDAEEREGS